MEDLTLLRALWRPGAIAAALATAVNLVILGVGRVAGISPIVSFGPGAMSTEVGAFEVIVNTLVPFGLGLLLTALVVRRRPHRLRTMQMVAAVIAAVSLIPPLTVDAQIATRIMLAVMHVVVGAAFLAALGRSGSPTTGIAPRAAGRPASTERHV